MRTQFAQASAARAGEPYGQVLPAGPYIAASRAPAFEDLAMHVNEVFRAGAFVQIVDVLCHHQDLAKPAALQLRQRQMRAVRPDRRIEKPTPSRIIEVVHGRGIAREGFRRCHILDAVARPDAVRIAKGVQTGVAADPGAGQDDDSRILCHLPSSAG
jgi:hypothetical protein